MRVLLCACLLAGVASAAITGATAQEIVSAYADIDRARDCFVFAAAGRMRATRMKATGRTSSAPAIAAIP